MCSATLSADTDPFTVDLKFQCPRALCVLRLEADLQKVDEVEEPWEFQCPLELCVFCDWMEPESRETINVETILVSVPSRALCVLRRRNEPSRRWHADGERFQCPLELCVFCDLAFPVRAVPAPLPTAMRAYVVSVPSRALCVLRLITMASPKGNFPEFQCPLELCVFCDWSSDKRRLPPLICPPFQCPLELCVFCDTGSPTSCTIGASPVSVPSRALCVLRPCPH